MNRTAEEVEMTETSQQLPADRRTVFARVLVGVDGSEASFEACRQVAVLVAPDAAVEAVAVVHLADAVQAGFEAPRARDVLREEAERALATAAEILGPRAETRFVNGLATAALLREITAFEASVAAVGSHGHRLLTDILLGGVAGELLHSAPCSVLIARPRPASGGAAPGVVVGLDGSEESAAALAQAGELAARLGIQLRPLVATRGKQVDVAAARRLAPDLAVVDAHPVDALAAAGRGAALVVVGSRGLHGLRALGSVSERVAHRAPCTVLVVRHGPRE